MCWEEEQEEEEEEEEEEEKTQYTHTFASSLDIICNIFFADSFVFFIEYG